MADWRKLALATILADGTIDEAEVKVLKKELYADGKLDKQEFAFLVELRDLAQKKAKGQDLHPEFEKLFFKGLQERILSETGVLSKDAVATLEQAIFGDKKADEGEKKFVAKLKKAVTKANADFDAFCVKVLGEPAPAAKPAAKPAAAKSAAKATPAKAPAKAPAPAKTPAPAPAPAPAPEPM